MKPRHRLSGPRGTKSKSKPKHRFHRSLEVVLASNKVNFQFIEVKFDEHQKHFAAMAVAVRVMLRRSGYAGRGCGRACSNIAPHGDVRANG
jgi:hypothetical protein